LRNVTFIDHLSVPHITRMQRNQLWILLSICAYLFFTLCLSCKAWAFTCASCCSAILHAQRPPLCNSLTAARNIHYLRTAEGSKMVSRYYIYHYVTWLTLTTCLNTFPVCHSLWQKQQCHVDNSYCALGLLLKQWPLQPSFTLYTLHLAAPCIIGFPITIHNHHFFNQRYPSRRCNETVCLHRRRYSWTRLWRPRSLWHLSYNVTHSVVRTNSP